MMDTAERLNQARLLVEQLEAGDEHSAQQTLEILSGDQNRELYQQVGHLTREIHEAINNFLQDQRLAEMAEREIPDASERLKYVIEMTESSANKTLSAVENSIPLVDEVNNSAQALHLQWTLFKDRQLTVEDFRLLSKDLSAFLERATHHSEQIHADMTTVLMAQDFQDLTGQIIRQVITLVHDIEEKMVDLVRISGSKLPEKQNDKDKDKLEGPVVPTVDQGDVVSGQDDVDELLSSLGF